MWPTKPKMFTLWPFTENSLAGSIIVPPDHLHIPSFHF